MNYIKGSRYQMYCEAREVGVRTCTVRPFSLGPTRLTRRLTRSTNAAALRCDPARPVPRVQRGSTRLNSLRARNVRLSARVFGSHAPLTSRSLTLRSLDNLISRFEEPNSAARWDAPLVTVASDDPPLDERADGGDVAGSEAAQQVWRAITEGELKPPNLATQTVRCGLRSRCCAAQLEVVSSCSCSSTSHVQALTLRCVTPADPNLLDLVPHPPRLVLHLPHPRPPLAPVPLPPLRPNAPHPRNLALPNPRDSAPQPGRDAPAAAAAQAPVRAAPCPDGRRRGVLRGDPRAHVCAVCRGADEVARRVCSADEGGERGRRNEDGGNALACGRVKP